MLYVKTLIKPGLESVALFEVSETTEFVLHPEIKSRHKKTIIVYSLFIN
jgi:hypothetical protein